MGMWCHLVDLMRTIQLINNNVSQLHPQKLLIDIKFPFYTKIEAKCVVTDENFSIFDWINFINSYFP